MKQKDGVMEKIRFYREIEFKETEIGRIPNEWRTGKLGSFTEIIMGQSPPSTSYSNEAGIPFLQGKAEFGRISPKHVKFTNSSIKIAPKDSILLSVRAPVGDVNIADIDYCIGRGLACLVPKKILKDFLFYLFQKMKSELENQSGGSTFKSITKNVLENFKIPFPPLSEQKAIAKVLKDFDDLIEVVERQIENFERIKKGLMEKYFSEGIFEHKEFKETGVGKIPKEWKVKPMKEIAKKMFSGGTPSTKVDRFWGGKIPWITSASMEKRIVISGVQYLTEEGLKNSSTKVVPANNLLIGNRVGVGKVSINLIDIAISQDITGVVLDKSKIDLDYAFWVVNYFGKKVFSKIRRGSTIKGITKKDIENLHLPLPSLPEQKEIASRLKAVDDLIETKREEKERLERAKKKVMELLLTGKVRVKSE